MNTQKISPVVVGVIQNQHQQLLLAKRTAKQEMGGWWEFPGGKIEAGESKVAALKRELKEELGIEVLQQRPLIQFSYQYPNKVVLLHVFLIESFAGEPQGLEGQALEWLSIDDIDQETFLPASKLILPCLQLPTCIWITPEFNDLESLLSAIESKIEAGISMIQLRQKQLNIEDYVLWAKQCLELCKANKIKLILNAKPEILQQVSANGVHLNSQALMALEQRPISDDFLLSASCHNLDELTQAQAINADFVSLSPVNTTSSHPEARALGWDQFSNMIEYYPLPVYALGGLSFADLGTAQAAGAQGIAGINRLTSITVEILS